MPPWSERGRPGSPRRERPRRPEPVTPLPPSAGPRRFSVIVWSVLLGLLVGWEFTGLAFGSRGWPTLSGIGRFFMGLPAGRWALYTAWIWLGWDFLPTQDGSTLLPGTGWQRKVLRGVVLGAVLGYAWWAAFLRSDLRWVDIIVPAAVLLLLAVLGRLRRTIPLSEVSDQVLDWLRRQRRRAAR